MSSSIFALIPARAGSKRVAGKNVRPLMGHPLLAYSIAAAKESGIFNRIVVTTDSPEFAEIAHYYGAEAPFLRPKELAESTSPDIDWILHAFNQLGSSDECFSILRPTSPFRSADTIRRAWNQFLNTPDADSIRAVELCHEHPGKMWRMGDGLLIPLWNDADAAVPSYDAQYQSLPKIYIQNSSLEMARTSVVLASRLRGGKKIAPFLTEGVEGFSIDYEDEWNYAQQLAETGRAQLPKITLKPYRKK